MDEQIIRKHSDRLYSIKSNRHVPDLMGFLQKFSEDIFSHSGYYISVGLEIDESLYNELLDDCSWFESNEPPLQDAGIFRTSLGEIYIFPRKNY